MAGTTLLALIDDIASVLDDVAVMSKVAVKKTAGVLGDDLALNAEQVTGVKADRELPVVWAVAVGSLKNKAILVPALLAISAFVPWAVMPLLMLGGAYLCFEGAEKLAHKFLPVAPDDADRHAKQREALADEAVDMVAFERDKIKGAIRTDFVLSAEILVITLGTVANASFPMQIAVMVGIALVMTIGVYGLVAAIVKLDDAGLYLSRREGKGTMHGLQRSVGRAILRVAPLFMKALSVIGTVAMFMVGGGILVHGIPGAHEWFRQLSAGTGAIMEVLLPVVLDAIAGVVAGVVLLGALLIGKAAFGGARQSA